MSDITHTAGSLATAAIDVIRTERGGYLHLRGVPQRIEVEGLNWMQGDASYVMVADLPGNQTMHFAAQDLVAFITPSV